MSGIVTLLTDFGDKDAYVAEMKGVLLSLNPKLNIVDITHAIEPQDISHGAYVLGAVARRFPADTIHVAVVDPGVGSARKPLVVSHDLGLFIGPDNGLLTSIIARPGLRAIHEISNPNFVEPVVSRTFHGRDVFAPAAAHASLGVDVDRLGPQVSDPVKIEQWMPEITTEGATGQVIHIDRFGNLVTNINLESFAGRTIQSISVGECIVEELSDTYSDVASRSKLVLIGSQDSLEISINGGDAAKELQVARGDRVSVAWGQS